MRLDPFMNTALSTYVMSVTKQRIIFDAIENSITFHGLFEDVVKQTPEENQIAGLVSNLGMAKHRFSSLSKRLGRFVGRLNAIFQTAEMIRIVRRGKDEAKMACDFFKEFTLNSSSCWE